MNKSNWQVFRLLLALAEIKKSLPKMKQYELEKIIKKDYKELGRVMNSLR